MSFVYLAAILVSMVAMLGIDYKYRLAFFDDARATSIVLVFGLGIFSVWDLVGISLGIFFSGHSSYMSGIYLLPEYPIEEAFFLLFLCYFTLIVYIMGAKKWQLT